MPLGPRLPPVAALWGTALRRRLLVVDALGLLCALAALVLAVRALPTLLGLLGALLLLVLGRTVRVPLRLGERRVLVSAYAEGAVVLTVLLVPPAWTPLLAGLVTLLGQVPRRLPWWRALFNTCALVMPVAAAAGVYALVAPQGASAARVATALLVACPVASLLNLVAVSGVVAAAHDEPWWPSLRRDLPVELSGAAVQAGVLAGAVACWATGQVVAAALVPVLGAVVLRGVLLRLHRATEEDALRRLEAATRPVTALDTAPAAAVVLTRAGDLFGVDAAQLVVASDADQPQRVWTWTRGGGAQERLDGRTSVRRRGETTTHELHDDQGAPLGRLLLHFPRPPQLSEAEQHVLGAFLSTVAHTLERCRDLSRRTAGARRDLLTGLGNRLDLEQRLLELPDDEPAALLLFGLAGLRRITDTFGYAAGEDLLREVATRLRSGLRAPAVALRLGNEDFAVLLTGLPDDGGDVEALQCARRLLTRLEAPFVVDELELPLEPAVGLALTALHGRSAEQLVRRADAALAECGRSGLPVVLHGTAGPTAEDDSVLLLGQLQSGLRLGEIEVHYQPVVDLADGAVVAAEALVRWRHPVLGLLGPARFVPLAEQTRLIVPLTLEVLDQAVSQAAAWRREPGPELSVAVNLSPRCLLLPDLAREVLTVLALHGLPARLLVLEITETLALTDLPQVRTALEALRSAGVRLSLDDFGTGFSSMSALRSFAVDEVKVDRSFVAAAPHSPSDRAVITATVALARGLGLPVVAEGIETQEQLDLVRVLGCDHAQGYLLGRPAPAAELSRTLRGASLR